MVKTCCMQVKTSIKRVIADKIVYTSIDLPILPKTCLCLTKSYIVATPLLNKATTASGSQNRISHAITKQR